MSDSRWLPAEWARQSGVMLTWPHAHGDWKRWLPQVETVFVAIAREVALREKVLISCFDGVHREHVAALLAAAGVPARSALLLVVPSNDTWARDHGPITVIQEGVPTLMDFGFNGWGGKFRHDLDDRITASLHQLGAFGSAPREAVDLILEGGSIESDGQGTLLTTTECLLAPSRNPQLDRTALEASLSRLLGVNRFLWLEHGYLEGDDTDGHIDTLARFCDPKTIAYVACDDPGDSHFAPLQAMAEQLAGFRDLAGNPYRLIPLPIPGAKIDEEGQRLPATYANFLIINEAVLVPTYRDPADAIALERLSEAFPDRQVVAVDAMPLIYQYGSLHCVTMQLPEGVIGDAA